MPDQRRNADRVVSVRLPYDVWRAMRLVAIENDTTVSGLLRREAEQLVANSAEGIYIRKIADKRATA